MQTIDTVNPTILRFIDSPKAACHGAILGFVMGHDLRRLFVSR